LPKAYGIQREITDVDKLEGVQKRATKLIPALYRERLKILNLPTLKYRRYRGIWSCWRYSISVNID